MCILCDGTSPEEAHEQSVRALERYGWVLTAVERSPINPPWVYSIGLLERFDHPELVVVGLDPQAGGALLNHLGERIRAGAVLRPSTTTTTEELDGIRFGDVHPSRWTDGTFASWEDHYLRRGAGPTSPAAVQVFLDRRPVTRVVLLDDPDAALERTALERTAPNRTAPNRSERRRHDRATRARRRRAR